MPTSPFDNSSSATRRAFIKSATAAALSFATTPVFGATAPKHTPNIVLIVMDTVRADHLSAYGYTRDTTPALRQLADQATTYTQARSTASWTLPAHASLFTGRYPFEHQCHRYKAAVPIPGRATFTKGLEADHRTLAEALHDIGYKTGSIAANSIYLNQRHGLLQGFDNYFSRNVRADRIVSETSDWIAANKNHSFFLFANFMDAHTPYNTNPRPGVIEGEVPDGERFERALYAHFRDGTLDQADPALRQTVKDQYDLGIANADHGIQRILDQLHDRGLYHDALIIITGDHGEVFGEHDLVGHSKDVYDGIVRVPLIVKHPGQRDAATIDTLTSIAHIPAIIADALDPATQSHFDILRRPEADSELIISENRYARSGEFADRTLRSRLDRIRVAAYQWPYKLIHSTDAAHELYNLEQDPKESTNLINEKPEIAQALHKALAKFRPLSEFDTIEDDQESPLTEEEKEEMRALGYLE